MIAITLNGREERINIGCRTFIPLNIFLNLLESGSKAVSLNGITIPEKEFASVDVKGGDVLELS